MALLKSLIQRLLDSRTTPEEAGHSAMPKGDYITLDLTKGSDATYVAPADGYFNVEVESQGYINCWGTMLTAASNGIWNKVFIPVKKGEVVKYQVNGNIIYAAFVKLIGWGGYNRLVRRALSCLRPSFNYLPKVSSRAKNSGLAAKPSLIQELNSVTQQEGMSLQRTDTSVSSIQTAQEAIFFLTSTQERIQVVLSETVGCFLRTLTRGLLSLLKKECQSILRRIQSQSRFGSAQQPVGADLRTGGALC